MSSAQCAKLTIRLLGDLQITYDNRPVTDIVQQREQALLAWLLIHRHAPQPRSLLAFSLWPDSTEAQALTNLRKTLLLLRRHLPDADTYLSVDRHQLQWRADAPCVVDMVRFEAELAGARSAGSPALARQRLASAVELYGGDLLPGCYEEWIFPIRERFRQEYMSALGQLIDLLEENRQYGTAAGYVQRSLSQDPLHEAAYLRLMRLYALQGDRARSLRVYHTCATLLQREMGVAPNVEIQAAYTRLLTADGGEEAVQPPIVDTSPVGVATHLIGRQPEWTALRAAWQNLQRQPVHVVVLAGEAGIGKTRLGEELANWTERQGIVTARARAYAAAGSLAYAPICDWLRMPRINAHLSQLGHGWLTELARLLPELLHQYPTLPAPQPFTEGWQRQRLYTALAHGLLAGNQPLLLTLDDLQWCDGETLTWLHYFLRFAEQEALRSYPQSRLLLVCTFRDNETDAGHPLYAFLQQRRQSNQLTELMLAPLTEAETGALAEAISGGSVPPAQAAQIFADTGGNPLYVVESMRAVEDEQMPTGARDAGASTSMLPANVHALIRARLNQLSANTQEIVGLAAVIGRSFRYELLASTSTLGDDDVVQSLEELWKRRIIQEAGRDEYDFSHDRLRDVAYAELSRPRRRLFHRRVAEALVQNRPHNRDDVSGQIADHYERAGLSAAAATYYLEAGDLALNHWAAAQAAHYFTRAFELAADVDCRAHSVYGLAAAHFLLGHRDKALAAVEQALALLDTPDHALRPRLLYLQADLHFAEAEPEAAESAVRQALAVAEQIDDQDTLCQSLSLLGQIHSHRGELRVEIDLIARAMAIARARGNRWREARTQADLAFLHAQMGEFAAAIPLAQAALDYLESTTDRGGVAFAWNILGRAHGGMGKFDRAMHAFETCKRVAEEIDLKSMSLQIPNMLGWIHYQLGDYGGALALDQESVELSLRAGAVTPEISARLNVCLDRLALDGPEVALAELQDLEHRMARGAYGFHGWRWRLRLLHSQGLCHLQRRDPDRVLGLAAEGAALARRTSARKYIALNHELTGAALAQRGQWTEAAHALEEAMHTADAIDCLPVGWRVRVRLAQVCRCFGSNQQADALMAAAGAMVEAIAADLGDAGLRATFLASVDALRAETEQRTTGDTGLSESR